MQDVVSGPPPEPQKSGNGERNWSGGRGPSGGLRARRGCSASHSLGRRWGRRVALDGVGASAAGGLGSAPDDMLLCGCWLRAVQEEANWVRHDRGRGTHRGATQERTRFVQMMQSLMAAALSGVGAHRGIFRASSWPSRTGRGIGFGLGRNLDGDKTLSRSAAPAARYLPVSRRRRLTIGLATVFGFVVLALIA